MNSVRIEQLLSDAATSNYVVGGYFVSDKEELDGVIKAAEYMHSPVFVYTDAHILPLLTLCVDEAAHAKVPVVVHAWGVPADPQLAQQLWDGGIRSFSVLPGAREVGTFLMDRGGWVDSDISSGMVFSGVEVVPRKQAGAFTGRKYLPELSFTEIGKISRRYSTALTQVEDLHPKHLFRISSLPVARVVNKLSLLPFPHSTPTRLDMQQIDVQTSHESFLRVVENLRQIGSHDTATIYAYS